MEHTFWANAGRVPANFRGPGGYLGLQETYKHQEIYEAARKVDKLGLLDRLTDDDAFGAITKTMPDGKVVTRDLLDSVLEINWLADHVPNLPVDTVQDIGAGYGRLEHRLLTAFPEMRVYSEDKIGRSSADRVQYLRARNMPAVKCDWRRPDLAVAIHSFSEMPVEWVTWWLEQLRGKRVPLVFVIPNTRAWYTSESYGQNDGELWRLLTGAAKLKASDSGWPIPTHGYEDGGSREYTLWEMR